MVYRSILLIKFHTGLYPLYIDPFYGTTYQSQRDIFQDNNIWTDTCIAQQVDVKQWYNWKKIVITFIDRRRTLIRNRAKVSFYTLVSFWGYNTIFNSSATSIPFRANFYGSWRHFQINPAVWSRAKAPTGEGALSSSVSSNTRRPAPSSSASFPSSPSIIHIIHTTQRVDNMVGYVHGDHSHEAGFAFQHHCHQETHLPDCLRYVYHD